MKVPAPYLGSSGITSNTGRRRGTSLQLAREDIWAPLSLCWQGHRFPWCLAGVEQLLLKVFCFVRLLFSSSLARESRFSWGLFYVCAFWHFWVASFLSYKSGIYEVKK